MNRTLLVLLALILIASVPSAEGAGYWQGFTERTYLGLNETISELGRNESVETVVMHYFWGEGCPFCEMQAPYNDRLLEDHSYLEIKSYEVYQSDENRRIYNEMHQAYGATPRGVPVTFIEGVEGAGVDTVIEVPLFGSFDSADLPVVISTIIIAFIDGFNPCSLWLLTFLLSILIHTRSRKKMIIVGGTFLLVTAAMYGVFIAGIFHFLDLMGMVDYVRFVVIALALLFAIVNIKDFFWYKRGISFTISDEHKPGLFKKMRRIMHPNQSTGGMVLATALLALGVTFVELPCTGQLPIIWSSLVSGIDAGVGFFPLLSLYLLIYLSIEVVILSIAIITLNKLSFTEGHGRVLKLISGMLMLVLALAFWFAFDRMDSVGFMITLFGIALLSSFVVYGLQYLFTRRKKRSLDEDTDARDEETSEEKESPQNEPHERREP